MDKRFIYFPSFSTMSTQLTKDLYRIGNLETMRFYDNRFPAEYQHKYFLLSPSSFLGIESKKDVRKQMGLEDSLVFGDSGGFQIANGTTPLKDFKIEELFEWLENNCDIAMNLDIPPKIEYEGMFEECLQLSLPHFKYFHEHQTGKVKYLNVLQADDDVEQYDIWYEGVKRFEGFNGWSIGGTKAGGHVFALYATALLLSKGEFEKVSCNYLHFLGVTSPFSFLIYAALQKNFNKHYKHITVSTDSSTPTTKASNYRYDHSLNFERLVFKSIWTGKDGTAKYNNEQRLPCRLNNCPICSNIAWGDLVDYKKAEHFYHNIAWHNLFTMISAIGEISDLVYSGNDVMKGFFSPGIIAMLKIIDDMFDEPKAAMDIFKANLQRIEVVKKLLGMYY